jgi:hydrogenase-4 component B
MQLLILSFFVLCGLGIVLSAVLPEDSSPRVILWAGSVASLVACVAGAEGLVGSSSFSLSLWKIPELGTLSFAMDHLSGLFLLVSGVVFFATSIFSARYLEQYAQHFSLRWFSVSYHVLWIAVAVILLAADAVLFLIAWEAMSILAYLLVNFQKEGDESEEAGSRMLIMSEAGFLAVALAFLLVGKGVTGLDFTSLRAAGAGLSDNFRWAVFLLSFFGFSVKAGLFPFNRWMRGVYAVAPANACALLSGVLLNLGIYGIVRVNSDLAPVRTAGPGLIVLAIGTISALVGILYANRENDLKTMLAESSAENMGIVVAAIGAGLVFLAEQAPVLAGIAFIAAFYHMMNHAVYKSLLFHSAGAVDSTVGTRDMDRLGGLIKLQPWIAGFFLVGVLSIAALPPFNGFVSEWLTLQTLLQSAALQSAGVKVVFALCGALLALTAGLAVTCFVKVYAMSFLGVSRSNGQEQKGRVHRSMRLAMGFLAALCLLLGILPTYVIPVLDQPVSSLVHTRASDALVPPFFTTSATHGPLPPAFVADFHDIGAQAGRSVLPGAGLVVLHRGGPANPVVFAMSTSYTIIVLLLLLGSAFFLVRRWVARRTSTVRKPVWAGGLRPLLPELTYTATGFSNPVRVTFNAIFHPTEVEDSSETVAEHFRVAIRRLVQEVHVLDRVFLRPVQRRVLELAQRFASMHHGRLNAYVAYILATFVAVLLLARIPGGAQYTVTPAMIVIAVLLADRFL